MNEKGRKSSFQDNDEISPEILVKPRIARSSLEAPGQWKSELSRYEPSSIEDTKKQFNVTNPGQGVSDTVLRMTNPKLYALGHRKMVEPQVKPLKQSLNQVPIAHGITSLLTKKPLSDLPEPVFTNNEEVKKKYELEKESLAFTEDPIAYFSKRKDGRGHLFIYMKHELDRKDPNFNPYQLVKVAHSDVGKEYFTMSASGVTHIEADGNTEHISLDKWAKEESIYKSIKKLRTFQQYLFWKPFRVWKNFIIQQHYQETYSKIINFPIYYNQTFSSTATAIAYCIYRNNEETDFLSLQEIIEHNLLSFAATRKYELQMFIDQSNFGLNNLTEQYKEFLSELSLLVSKSYNILADPENLEVKDEEFSEIRRKNPNIGQLAVLERKKEAARIYRQAQMDVELKALGNYMRLFDYMLLEAMREFCFNAFIEAAQVFNQDQSCVFQVEVYFSDTGKVSFNPSCEQLCDEITKALNTAVQTLDQLPRLLRHPDLRVILTKAPIDVVKLLDTAPDFNLMAKSSDLLVRVHRHIISKVMESFEQAEIHSQALSDFYPLFMLGKTWNVRDYITKADGSKFEGPLSISGRVSEADDNFLINPQEEPIVDFAKIEHDIVNLKTEDTRVKELQSGIVKGALNVDSKKLLMILKPIPINSLHDIQTTMKDLAQLKIDLTTRVLKSYTLKLKSEPTALEDFVDFCDLLIKIEKVMPQLVSEIKFVDRMIVLFEQSDFPSFQNPLHLPYQKFLEQRDAALLVREKENQKFLFVLRNVVTKLETKLKSYRDDSNVIPMSTKNLDIDAFFTQTMRLKKKAAKIQVPIQDYTRFQAVLNDKATDFGEYSDLTKNVAFSEALYFAIKQWEVIKNQITNVPFSHISTTDFIKDIDTMQQMLTDLKAMWQKPSPIISELAVSFEEVQPYVPQLLQLSNGRMQTRHWNELFEECGQSNGYTIQITIQELLQMQILTDKDRITRITVKSQGESKIENEFQAISAHWADITLPLAETNLQEIEKLSLGNLDLFIADINDTSVTLNNMLANRFVQGIKDRVLELAQKMDSLIKIISEWQKFQSNWTVLAPLFLQGVVKSSLPNQHTRFQLVQRKWEAIAKHTIQDTKILSILQYPTLLQDFEDNNRTLESILCSLNSFLEMKRTAIPRLYFMSNTEVLKILSTTDFSVFTAQLAKILMYIIRLDSHSMDNNEASITETAREGSTFYGLRIFGYAGEDGDIMQFVNSVTCNGPIDYWIPQLLTISKASLKDAISISLSRYSSSPIHEWLMTVSSYVAFITLQISFARDIEDCFNNIDTNPRAFIQYEATIKHRIHDLMNAMTTPLSNNDLQKFSSGLSIILYHFERTHMLNEKIAQYSHKDAWNDTLKIKYDTNTMNIIISFGDYTWEHGLEYWGLTPQIVISSTTEQALSNMCYSLAHGTPPLLFGAMGVGRSQLINYLACYFGQFIYHASSFPDFSNTGISKLLIGAIASGSWIHFSKIHLLPSSSIAYIYDTVQAWYKNNMQNIDRIDIEDNTIDIDKNAKCFFSTNIKSMSGTTIPPQLKSFARPTALSIPPLRKLLETKFLSYGFKSAKLVSQMLDIYIDSVLSITNTQTNGIKHYVQIVIDSQDILRQLMHSGKVDFVDYYSDSRQAEEFAAARAAFMYFKSLIGDEHYEILAQIAYKHFGIFDSYEVFREHVSNPVLFPIDSINSAIANDIKQYITDMGMELPIDYLTEKAVALYQMMANHQCVVIVGPPNSGKSLLLKLLEHAYASMVTDPEIVNRFKGIMAFKIIDIFMSSDSWDNIFGRTVVNESGSDFEYGLIHSVFTKLETVEKTHHRVIHFDGPISRKFAIFLSQMISSESHMRLNTHGTVASNHAFHIIVETDSLANVNPDLLSQVGILYMQNIQYESTKNISLLRPHIPFINAARYLKITPEICDLIQPYFSIYEQKIAKFLNELKTQYPISETLDRLMTDIAKIWMVFCMSSKIDLNTNLPSRISLGISTYYILGSLYPEEEASKLHKFILQTLDLNLPENWDGFSVNETFPIVHPTPSLLTVRPYNYSLMPIDTVSVSSRPIIRSSRDGSIPLFAKDVTVVLNHNIPSAEFIKHAVMYKRNIALYGPKRSGKSAVLANVFHELPNVIPINLWCSKDTTTSDIMATINEETEILSKSLIQSTDPPVYALIFDGIRPDNIELIEFIRKLIITHKITTTSKVDTKIFDVVSAKNFFIVIKATTLKGFSPRFISLFLSIRTIPYSQYTNTILCRKLLNTYSADIDLIDNFVVAMNEKINDSAALNNALLYLIHLPEKKFINEQQKLIAFSALITSQIRETKGRLMAEFQKVIDEFTKQFEGNEQMLKIIKEIGEKQMMVRPNYNLNPETKPYECSSLVIDRRRLKSDLVAERQTKITEQTLSNFIRVDLILSQPGCHISVSSTTGGGRATIIRMVANHNAYHLNDLTRIQIDPRKVAMEIFNAAVKESNIQIILLRVTPNTLDFVNYITSVFVDLNFHKLFENKEFEQFVKEFLKIEAVAQENRVDATKRTKDILKRLVHVAVVPEIPFKHSRFTEVLLYHPTKQEICDNLLSDKMKPLSDTLIKTSEKIEEIIEVQSNSMFDDFISYFVTSASGGMSRVITKNKNIHLTLNFFTILREQQAKIQAEDADVLPKLEALREKSDNLKVAYTAKHDAIEMRRLKLNEESMAKAGELGELKAILSDQEQVLESIEPIVKGFYKEIEDLTEEDMHPVRITANNPPPAVKMMFELLPALMDQAGSYQEAGIKLMMAPDYNKQIIDNINYKELSQSARDILVSYTQNQEFSIKELESVAPVLVVFRKFIEKINDYQRQMGVVRERRFDVEMALRDYTAFSEDMKQELESMNDIESQFDGDAKELNTVISDLKRFETKHAELETRRKNVEAILEGSELLESGWSDKNNKEDDTINGDIALTSVYVAYCGFADYELRETILTEAQKILNEAGIATSFKNPIKEISNRLIGLNTIKIDPSGVPQSALVDIQHLSALPRPSLLIDPDHIIIDILMSVDRAKSISITSRSAEAVIANAAENGLLVIVNDCDNLSPELKNICDIAQCKPEESFIINGKDVKIAAGFRIVFVTNLSDMESIPAEMLDIVAPVNASSSSVEAIRTRLIHMFIGYFNSALLKKLLQTEAAELEHHVQKSSHEFEMLEAFAELKESADDEMRYLSNTQGLQKIISSKNAYFASIKGATEGSVVRQEANDFTAPFEPVITFCQKMWVSITRYLPVASEAYRFTFGEYEKMIENVLQSSGMRASKNVNTEELLETIKKAVLNWILPSLSYNDAYYFMFISVFLLEDYSWDELDVIVKNLVESVNLPYVTQHKMPAAALEMMKSCTLPDFFEILHRFVNSNFKGASNLLPYFVGENAISSKANIPTLIIEDPENDQLHAIINYAIQRARLDSVDIVTASDNEEGLERMRKAVQTGMSHGNWVIVNYNQPSMIAASYINSLLDLYSTITYNVNFRLILNCNTIEFLSASLFSKCRKFTIEKFPSVRASMQTIMAYFGAQTRSSTMQLTKTLRRYFHEGALLFSSMRFRRFFSPLGLQYAPLIQEQRFREFFDYGKAIIERDEKLPMPRNLRDYSQEIFFGSAITETSDRRCLRAMMAAMFPAGFTEDGFTFLDQSSPDLEKYIQPGDGPLAQYTQQVNSISAFPSIEIMLTLRDTTNHLRKTRLGLYFVQPFMNLKPPFVDNEVIEKCKQLLEEVPEDICVESKTAKTPLEWVWHDEISFLNDLLRRIRRDLRNGEAAKFAAVGTVSHEWDSTQPSFAKFFQVLKLRREFLADRINDPNPPTVNVKFIERPKALMLALCSSTDGAQPIFSLEGRGTRLTGLYVFNGAVYDNKLVPPTGSMLTPLPPLVCCGMPASGHTFVCPLFFEFDGKRPENFIAEINIASDKSDRSWLLNNTSIFCRIPDQYL